jgi:tyrosyl-tRNA synthetase
METIQWFDSDDIIALSVETWSIEIQESETKILDMFTQSGLTSSNGDAKKMIQSGSLFINEVKVEDPQMIVSKSDCVNWVVLLRKGKKQYKIVSFK